jgi:hypothetical protein
MPECPACDFCRQPMHRLEAKWICRRCGWELPDAPIQVTPSDIDKPDYLLEQARAYVTIYGPSIDGLQKHLKVNYRRAARLIDEVTK